MNIFKTNIKIRATIIVIACLILATIGIWLLYANTSDAKVSAILGSLFAGLIVAIIQFIIAWQDYKQTEKLKELELIEVLYSRDSRAFYEKYIKRSQRKINMMGVTASRFFNDFADDSPNAPKEAQILLDALRRGVKVRILLPESDYIENINKKQDVDKVKQRVIEINKKYPSYSLEVKYFNHTPAHSIFNVDDKCIVGPVFPELESKYTPALYLRNSSPIANKYLTYFEYEWNRAE
ncbi:MAG: hypothetical protein E6767_00580 [Dysgonomonas sp.]|nr:hypothetical protein [Dysgonomonas sp.]